MAEWWTYRLSDFLLFSPATYHRLFGLYNAAVWPAQVAAIALGLTLLVLLLRGPDPARRRIVPQLLAACWLFVAWAWFHERYATINWAAGWMAAAFVIEAILLVVAGVLGSGLTLARPSGAGRVGLLLVACALVVQPLLGPLAGRSWREAEIFGLAPDPTVLATLGVLLTARDMRWELLAIPLLWCAVSGATLWAMEAPDAALLPAAGAVTLGLALYRRSRT